MVAGGFGSPARADQASSVKYEDVTERAGIHFAHERAVFSSKLKHIMPWLTAGGAGVSVGDYDNDGLDDIYFTTSTLGKPNHLYHNEGGFRFREVAAEAGLARVNDSAEVGTSSFALWLDYDNDGWQDLFLLRFGISSLFHNERNGKFTDVTAAAGVARRTNALAATAFDYDRDGDVDLFIGGYFPEKNFFDPPDTRVLFDSWENARNGARNYLFRNEGGGKFVDVTEAAGFQDSGWAMAVGHGDINNDGWQDIYIANDFGPDVVLRNDKGKFVNITAKAIGVDTKKGMNAEFGDYNNDGLIDIYVTNMTEPYLSECNMLWRNNGDETFSDVSLEIHACDTKWGWGAKFVDVDNDGRLDIYAANGFITGGARDYMEVLLDFVLSDEGDLTDASRWPDMGDASMGGHERNELLVQGGQGFSPHAAQAGVDSVLDGRGVAIADFDGDGRMDMVVSNVNASPVVYRNVSSSANRWVEFHLLGTGKSNRSAVGARLWVTTSSGTRMREIASANGFDAQSTLTAHFGLGMADSITSVRVRWPDGTEQQAKGLSVNTSYTWAQGGEPKRQLGQPSGRAALVPAATLAATHPLAVATEVGAARPEFQDIATLAGVLARHHPPQFDGRLNNIMPMVAAGAAGAAIGDYNRDGYLDVFVNDSRDGMPNHLYRNNGDLTFTDVAATAGVADLNGPTEVCSGGLFFDFDGDGWEDLLILRFGNQVLMRNRRDGTFENVSKRAGFDKPVNALAVIAFDHDRDGDLDLYLGSYFQDVNMFRLARNDVMHDSWETSRNGGSNLFYRNNGDGTFTESTAKVGLTDTGWTMALAHADFDSDGWQDIYVANDFGPDKLFHNAAGKGFEDVTARTIGADTKKGMNAEAVDYDNDGDLDVFVTNVTEGFLHECNMLWQNDGHGAFADVSQELGTCDTGWGWAGKFFDYDNDMDLDLYVANGFFDGGGSGDYLDDLLPALWDKGENPTDVSIWPRIDGKGIANRERNVFFTSAAGKRFTRVDGNGLDVPGNSRGILLGDFDNDGRVDLFVTNNDAQVALFHNVNSVRNHWLEVELAGRGANTHAIGARIMAHTGNVVQMREVNAGNGFGGGSMVRQHIGLGANTIVDRLVVRWPDGFEETLRDIAGDRVVRIREGAGRAELVSRGNP